MIDETGSSANTMRNGPTSGGGGTFDSARDAISGAASQAGAKVVSGVNTQKARAADSLGSVAQALRQSGDQLRSKDTGMPVGQYISTAADRVERLSDYLRRSTVSNMMGEVEQFARRQPAVFIGGALMLGLLGARFLKSSGRGNADAQRSSSPTYDDASSRRTSYVDPRTSAGYDTTRDARTYEETGMTQVHTRGENY
nr:hypothetical protein Hi04_10k_c5380_00015 [uncultured bacterium]